MSKLGVKGRHLWASALVCAGLLGGCAQTPSQQAGAQTPQASAQSQQAARRDMLMAYMRHAVQNDSIIESISGLPPGTPNFAALKAAMVGIYTDDVVLEWMVAELDKGVAKERFVSSIGSRMFSGANRLKDNEALMILSPMGDVFSRMDAAQCKAFNARPSGAGASTPSRETGFALLVAAMTPGEIVQFFEGIRLSLRADLQALPLRPTPTKQQMADTFKAFDQYAGTAGKNLDSCQQAARLMRTIKALPDQHRSPAITFVLAMMGMGANKPASVAAR